MSQYIPKYLPLSIRTYLHKYLQGLTMRLRDWIASLGIFGCLAAIAVNWSPTVRISLDTWFGLIAVFAAIVTAFFCAGSCAETIYLKRMDTLWSRVVATLLTPVLPFAVAYVPQYNSLFSFSYSDYLLKLFYVGIPAGLILGRILLLVEPLTDWLRNGSKPRM
jgi:hypothetical protein